MNPCIDGAAGVHSNLGVTGTGTSSFNIDTTLRLGTAAAPTTTTFHVIIVIIAQPNNLQ